MNVSVFSPSTLEVMPATTMNDLPVKPTNSKEADIAALIIKLKYESESHLMPKFARLKFI